jgi:hypothetical protein
LARNERQATSIVLTQEKSSYKAEDCERKRTSDTARRRSGAQDPLDQPYYQRWSGSKPCGSNGDWQRTE